MPSIPIATFLAGSLLSLLLPTLLLIALVVWYWMFIRRVPDTAGSDLPPQAPGTSPGAGHSAPTPPGEPSPPPAGGAPNP